MLVIHCDMYWCERSMTRRMWPLQLIHCGWVGMVATLPCTNQIVISGSDWGKVKHTKAPHIVKIPYKGIFYLMICLTFEMGGEEENSSKFLAASFGSNPSFFTVDKSETIVAKSDSSCVSYYVELNHCIIIILYLRTILSYTQVSRLANVWDLDALFEIKHHRLDELYLL